MKLKITLRMRITIIVAVVLIVIIGCLTAFSILASNRYFVSPQLNKFTEMNRQDMMHKEIIDEGSPIPPVPKGNLPQLDVVVSVQEASRSFNIGQFISMFIFTVTGIILTYYVVGKALIPLTKLSITAQTIDEHHLATQIIVPKSNDEIYSLASSFNSMLARLKSSFDVQKNFAANAAHELKTPLTTMKSSIQVLNLDDNPSIDDYKENVQVIEESVDKLIEIVNHLLMLSSSTSEQKALIPLHQLIENCITQAKSEMDKKNIRIVKTLEKTDIYGNLTLLESVINNLISNAVKYNETNGDIEIILENKKKHAIVKISDTGVGIAEEQLPHIFEPFYRVDPSRSKKVLGNGLGLPIVKTILEKMDGSIEVESSLGKGTNVIVKIPLH